MDPIILVASNTLEPGESGVSRTSRSFLDAKVTWMAEGLSSTRHSYTDKDGVTHEWDEVEHVEQVPPRLYGAVDVEAGVVVPINGRRYRVQVKLRTDEDAMPLGASVVFTPTGDPETPYKTWDGEAVRARLLADLREDRSETQTMMHADPPWVTKELARLDARIARLESGEERLRPHVPVRFFGVPDFIQNSIFPALGGKAAQNLVTLETGWGDCGNVNLLFACDAEGVPCKVWFEASCA